MAQGSGGWRRRRVPENVTAVRFFFSSFLNAVYSADQFMEKLARDSERKRRWLANSKRSEPIIAFFKAIRNDVTHNYVPQLGKNYEIEFTAGLRRSHVAAQYFVPEESSHKMGSPRLSLDPPTLSPETAALLKKYQNNQNDRGSLTYCCRILRHAARAANVRHRGRAHPGVDRCQPFVSDLDVSRSAARDCSSARPCGSRPRLSGPNAR